MRAQGSQAWAAHVVMFLTYLSLATSISYAAFVHGPDLARTDAPHYIALYNGTALEEVPAPFRFRVVTPMLAAWVPRALVRGLPMVSPVDVESEARLRFALVNLVGLALTSHLLFLLLSTMGFSSAEAALGGCLFLLLLYPVAFAALPMTDALAFAFLVGGLYALEAGSLGLLFWVFSIGIFQKETIVLVPMAALLTSERWKWKAIALMLPALMAYLAFRLSNSATPDFALWTRSVQSYASEVFLSGRRLNLLFHAPFSFGFLWILAALGWREGGHSPTLSRWRLLLPVILVTPFVLVLNVQRTWTYAFPVIIPLALLGLRRFWIVTPSRIEAAESRS